MMTEEEIISEAEQLLKTFNKLFVGKNVESVMRALTISASGILSSIPEEERRRRGAEMFKRCIDNAVDVDAWQSFGEVAARVMKKLQ
jgi:hypothetical protein